MLLILERERAWRCAYEEDEMNVGSETGFTFLSKVNSVKQDVWLRSAWKADQTAQKLNSLGQNSKSSRAWQVSKPSFVPNQTGAQVGTTQKVVKIDPKCSKT